MATATPAYSRDQHDRSASTSRVLKRALGSGLGTHLLVEMWKSPFASLADASHIEKILDRAGTIEDSLGRQTSPDVHVYQFNPYGVSGTASSEKAHILIHTWPEKNFAAIDIFAKDHNAAYKVLENMKRSLKPGLCNVVEVTRGKLIDMEDT